MTSMRNKSGRVRKRLGWFLSLILAVGLLLLLPACSGAEEGTLPTLVPRAVVPQGTSEAVKATAVAFSGPAQVALENGQSLTQDPAEFLLYEPTGLGIRLMYPPEMEVMDEALDAGTFSLLVGGDLSIDTAEGVYEGTSLSVYAGDAALYASIPDVDIDDPVSVLETAVLPGYTVTEIIQEPTAIDVNGLPGAAVLIHQKPFPGEDVVRSKYVVVVLDGDRVLLLDADVAVADEPVFLPVAQNIVNSLEIQRGTIP